MRCNARTVLNAVQSLSLDVSSNDEIVLYGLFLIDFLYFGCIIILLNMEILLNGTVVDTILEEDGREISCIP